MIRVSPQAPTQSDMAMPVQGDRAPPQRLELSHEGAAVDQRGTNARREGGNGLRIFHEMVMQRDEPARPGKLTHGHTHVPHLLGGDEAQRVGEGKNSPPHSNSAAMTPSPSSGPWRQDHGKQLVPDHRYLARQSKASPCRQRRRSSDDAAPEPSIRCGRNGRICDPSLRTRSPWTASMAESARIWRRFLPILLGSSRRAGLDLSTTLRSWLPGSIRQRSRKSGNSSSAPMNSAHSLERPQIGHVAAHQDDIHRLARMPPQPDWPAPRGSWRCRVARAAQPRYETHAGCPTACKSDNCATRQTFRNRAPPRRNPRNRVAAPWSRRPRLQTSEATARNRPMSTTLLASVGKIRRWGRRRSEMLPDPSRL